MRKKLLRLSALLAVVFTMTTGFSERKLSDLSQYSVDGLDLCYTVPNELQVRPLLPEPILRPNRFIFLDKCYIGFKEALGFKESRGNYSSVNQFGYLGKYQFAKNTLRMIGIKNAASFLGNSKLQEKAFSAYTARNKWILRKDIKRYNDKIIGGVKITESGILAAAHLAGAGNVKKFLRTGGENGFNDANGTSVRYYLKKFSGYDTSLVPANRRATVL